MGCHVLLLSTDSQVPMCREKEGTWGQGCRVCEVSGKTFLSSLFYLNVVIMHYFFCRGGSRLDNTFGSCSFGCSRCGFDYSCGQLLLFLENVKEERAWLLVAIEIPNRNSTASKTFCLCLP